MRAPAAVAQRLCASPQYILRYGQPASLAELATHRCAGFSLATTGRLVPWQLLVDGEMRRVDLPVVFCANDSDLELDAVLAGVGIGLIDGLTGAGKVQAGRLAPMLESNPGPEVGFHLYFAQRRNLPRRVRTFIDFIVQRMQDSPLYRFDAAPRRGRSEALLSAFSLMAFLVISSSNSDICSKPLPVSSTFLVMATPASAGIGWS
jgi:DNA-binding transcriptional LysR family regulator